MPLTKSEFDRWKAQADEASVQMADTPAIHELALIYRDGFLRIMQGPSGLGPVETRALYEMLRAWYGEDAQKPVPVSAVANELIEAAVSWRINCDNEHVGCSELPRVRRAVDAYLAEQTEKEKTQ